MQQIVITADSTFDMPPYLAEQKKIKILPSYVRLGQETYDDYPEIKQRTLFEYYERTHELPQTIAASPNDYTDFFSQYATDENAVIHIAKSSEMSCCYNNALIAAREIDHVLVIDSKNISGGSALLALRATEQSGNSSPQALAKQLYKYRDGIDGSFIIDQLEYLYKGGRCSSLSLLGANTLQIRPCITIKNGKMSVGRKFRGSYKRCLFSYIDEKLTDLDSIDPKYLFISHSVQDKALLDSACQYIISKKYFEQVIAWPVNAGVAVHCGPNTFGMFYIHK